MAHRWTTAALCYVLMIMMVSCSLPEIDRPSSPDSPELADEFGSPDPWEGDSSTDEPPDDDPTPPEGKKPVGCMQDANCQMTESCCDGQCQDLQSDTAHCGACNTVCASPNLLNSSASCTDGECIVQCKADRGDCDNDIGNGCETYLKGPNNCGACGAVCDPANALSNLCLNGECTISACHIGWKDCNNDPWDGCECPA